jgi:hypothetical protein
MSARLGALVFLAVSALAIPAQAIVAVRTAVAYRPVAPLARTAAVVGTAAVTAAAVGTWVNTLPPACSSVTVGNAVYQQCGSTWYQPRYVGSSVNYVVVPAPR